LLKKIKNEEIRNFTKEVLDHAPKQFWSAPSSSSGKHHPPEDNGKGGLVTHTIKATLIAEDICRYFNLPDIETDEVISATMLHDIQKNGIPWGDHTVDNHGLVASKWLEIFDYPKSFYKDFMPCPIVDCVRFHMGRFADQPEDKMGSTSPSMQEIIVQMSDFVASREYASWLPNIPVKEEDILRFRKRKFLVK